LTEADIELLEKLVKDGREVVSEDSIGMESLKIGIDALFNIPDYDDVLITQILDKLEKINWDVSPQRSQLELLRSGIKNSKQHLDLIAQSETNNIFNALDQCLSAYRMYCQSWIHLNELKRTVVIMAQNYLKTIQR
jgi:hypothetical protein